MLGCLFRILKRERRMNQREWRAFAMCEMNKDIWELEIPKCVLMLGNDEKSRWINRQGSEGVWTVTSNTLLFCLFRITVTFGDFSTHLDGLSVSWKLYLTLLVFTTSSSPILMDLATADKLDLFISSVSRILLFDHLPNPSWCYLLLYYLLSLLQSKPKCFYYNSLTRSHSCSNLTRSTH